MMLARGNIGQGSRVSFRSMLPYRLCWDLPPDPGEEPLRRDGHYRLLYVAASHQTKEQRQRQTGDGSRGNIGQGSCLPLRVSMNTNLHNNLE